MIEQDTPRLDWTDRRTDRTFLYFHHKDDPIQQAQAIQVDRPSQTDSTDNTNTNPEYK